MAMWPHVRGPHRRGSGVAGRAPLLVLALAVVLALAGGAVWALRREGGGRTGGGSRAGEAAAPTPIVATAEDVGGLELRFEGWSPLFVGVAHGHGSSPMGRAGRMEIDALRIDLDAPGLAVVGTPSNGDAPLETTAETTPAFLERLGLAVAVNAHFFAPCCDSEPEPKDLVGLAVSAGELVSPPAEGSGTGACVLVVRDDRGAEVLGLAAPSDLGRVDVAVAGSHVLLRDGELVAPPDAEEGFQHVHPRTAAGVSADGRTLYLLTIDGRQIGWSNGATLRETAAWLRLLGADDALNLDGGGSTTMVRAEAGRAVVMNRPVGLKIPGTLRWNGSNLGVVARPR